MAKFNDDMAGIFSMLQQMDGIHFARSILEPPIIRTVDAPAEGSNANRTLQVGYGMNYINSSFFQMGEQRIDGNEQNRSALYSNGITVSIGDRMETQIEQKPAVPWLQHNTHDVSTPAPSTIGNEFFPSEELNGINGIVKMEMDYEATGEPTQNGHENGDLLLLEQMFGVAETSDIGQVRAFLWTFLCINTFLFSCSWKLKVTHM
jgi:hypothetical protein